MERRTFLGMIAGSLLAAPLAAEAQPAGKVYRIGMLERTSPATNAANLEAFRRGLRELGYVEGKNLVIEYRSADGRDERYAALATELIRLNVDLILTRGTPAALAAKNATSTIPVVITGLADPVGQGIVVSLAHPGGNITGVSAIVTELYAKRVELLRELLPRAARIAALLNMGTPALPPAWKEIEAAARSFGLQPQLLDVRSPRLWPRHSRAQSGSVPTHSSSGSTPSRRRTRGSLLTLPLGIDCRRSMLPWSLPGRAPDAVRASDQPQDRQGPWPDDPAVAPAAGGSGEHPPFPGRSAPTRPGEIGSWRRAFPLNS